MTEDASYLGRITRVLERQHAVTDLDPDGSTFTLGDGDRSVRVELQPNLLGKYFEELGERDIPDLAYSPPEDWDRVRARRIAVWIAEMFESDIYSSLIAIRLVRAGDGRLSLEEERGSRRSSPIPPDAEQGSWSSDPT